ncbi:MAG: acylphosphatase [Candidatus Omnitrophota bacterium]|nr:acylphosphatase [Candidatus Omnitrophota bacterium]
MQKQVQVFYSGRVQGVGFRFTAVSLAEKSGVKGFVRNLDDGRVEVLAEAEEKNLEDFLAQVSREFSSYISDAQVSWSEPGGKFKQFEIRF